MSAAMPASSSTSRRAAASGVSPCSICPLGSTQSNGSRLDRTRRNRARSPRAKKTTPPAWLMLASGDARFKPEGGRPTTLSVRGALVRGAEVLQRAAHLLARQALGALAPGVGDGRSDGPAEPGEAHGDERLRRAPEELLLLIGVEAARHGGTASEVEQIEE